MSIWRFSCGIICVLLFTVGSLQALDESQMKAEMEARGVNMRSGRDEIRSFAGGTPEVLRSRTGRSNLRFGGEVKTKYEASFQSSDPDQPRYRRYNDSLSLSTARLNMSADFTPDTSAFIQLRLDQSGVNNAGHGNSGFLEEAWWQWRNIAGTGVNLRVGKLVVPFGEQYNGILAIDSFNDNGHNYGRWGTWNGINNPASFAWTPGKTYGVGPEASYQMGDFTIAAAVFDGRVNSLGGGGGFTPKNRAQYSALLNAAVKVDWDPSMIEGLHVSASYLGVHNYINQNGPNAGNYSPSFNVAAEYTHGSLNFFIENTMTFNGVDMDGRQDPGVGIYGGSFANTLTGGVTYNHNEKLSFTCMFDWGRLATSRHGWNNPGHGQVSNYRATIGANYDFNNGIEVGVAYAHSWCNWSIENRTRHSDQLVIQSVVRF